MSGFCCYLLGMFKNRRVLQFRLERNVRILLLPFRGKKGMSGFCCYPIFWKVGCKEFVPPQILGCLAAGLIRRASRLAGQSVPAGWQAGWLTRLCRLAWLPGLRAGRASGWRGWSSGLLAYRWLVGWSACLRCGPGRLWPNADSCGSFECLTDDRWHAGAAWIHMQAITEG